MNDREIHELERRLELLSIFKTYGALINFFRSRDNLKKFVPNLVYEETPRALVFVNVSWLRNYNKLYPGNTGLDIFLHEVEEANLWSEDQEEETGPTPLWFHCQYCGSKFDASKSPRYAESGVANCPNCGSANVVKLGSKPSEATTKEQVIPQAAVRGLFDNIKRDPLEIINPALQQLAEISRERSVTDFKSLERILWSTLGREFVTKILLVTRRPYTQDQRIADIGKVGYGFFRVTAGLNDDQETVTIYCEYYRHGLYPPKTDIRLAGEEE